MPRRSVTLHEVAQAAGVHPATVSRTLTRPDDVRPETRARVQEALDRLGYQPNRAARQLRTGRADALGVIVPDVTNPFFSAFLQETQGAIAGEGQTLLFADSRLDAAEERRLVEALAPEVDAIIVCSTVGLHRRTPQSSAPLVFVNRVVRGHPCVIVDQAAIIEIALGHLADRGHERVAFANGPSSYWSCQQRARAAERAAPRLGLRVTQLGHFDPTIDGGVAAAAAVEGEEVTALVAFNDLMALGAVGALRDAGVKVPRQLSVVGSDGIALGGMAGVGLTTVAAPIAEVGRVAVDLARQAAAGRAAGGGHVTIQPALLARSSTRRL